MASLMVLSVAQIIVLKGTKNLNCPCPCHDSTGGIEVWLHFFTLAAIEYEAWWTPEPT